MKFKKATEKYEAWLANETRVIAADLALKHRHMAEAPFPFLRATYYRWAQLWPEVWADLAAAPRVLAVGDLHVENFGTWRDIEGRLIWGVNDFDEVYPMAYANDLVRLAVSAHLAIAENHLALADRDACEAILAGYQEGLEAQGKPFVLEEHHDFLRRSALGELRDPVRFWEKMDGLPTLRGDVPNNARQALEHLLPEPGLDYRVAHRVAGLGSLGRERFVALAEWRGGKVAREAKALLPSACVWANGGKGLKKIFYQDAITRAVRVRDPFVELRGNWIVRRLAPHCCRIELASLPKERDESRLLHAMGFETANVHLGTKGAARAIGRDQKKRPSGWLHAAVKEMAKAVREDWEEWRKDS
jgi:uncharacterized protein DUF2252